MKELTAIAVALVAAVGTAWAGDPITGEPGAENKRQADADAIWEVRLRVKEALERGNVDLMMSLWTENGCFTQIMRGETTRYGGWEAIKRAHEEMFRRARNMKIEFRRVALRFPAPNVAIEDCTYLVTLPGSAPQSGRDTTVLIKRGNRWRMSDVRDFSPESVPPDENHTPELKTSKADIEEIHRLLDELCAAHKLNDGTRLAAFYTDDALLMPPNEPVVSGKKAIAAWYQRSMEEAEAELTCVPVQTQVAGEWAFTRGTFTVKITPRDGGQPVKETCKVLSILRRRPDRSWALYCDIWNSSGPRTTQH